jgi:hypothetical protein
MGRCPSNQYKGNWTLAVCQLKIVLAITCQLKQYLIMQYEINQIVEVENQTAIVTGFVPDDSHALTVQIPATGEAFEVDESLVTPIFE